MAESIHSATNSKSLRALVARYPIVVFVTLAYLISWIAWLLTNRIDMGVVNGFAIIGGAGPALAAMIMSALRGPEPSGIPAGKRWRLFGMTGIIVLAVLVVRRQWITADLVNVVGRTSGTVSYPTLTSFLGDVLAAVVVAFFLSGIHSQRLGVSNLLRSLNTHCQPIRWYWFAVAVGLYPVVILLGNAISTRLGLPIPASRVSGLWYWLAVDALIMFLFVMLGGGGLEEPGWRGFALPLLQMRYTPLRASLILAVMWTFWHWPLFWFGYSEGGPLGVFFFLFGVAPITLLFTAVFNRSRGSLPIVILLHTSVNITGTYLPPSTLASSLWMLMILGVAFVMWRVPKIFSIHNMPDKLDEAI
ncbi:MAG TPA: CPBP family intramembrane glutamic endopeptidase [Anaerolineales bacterium]|nr:CPBP family intramembrane glutamic endopeptidase [Anaerolineales bacterium]